MNNIDKCKLIEQQLPNHPMKDKFMALIKSAVAGNTQAQELVIDFAKYLSERN